MGGGGWVAKYSAMRLHGLPTSCFSSMEGSRWGALKATLQVVSKISKSEDPCPPIVTLEAVVPTKSKPRRSSSLRPRSRPQPSSLSEVRFFADLGPRGRLERPVYPGISLLPGVAASIGRRNRAQGCIRVVSSELQMKRTPSSSGAGSLAIDNGEIDTRVQPCIFGSSPPRCTP